MEREKFSNSRYGKILKTFYRSMTFKYSFHEYLRLLSTELSDVIFDEKKSSRQHGREVLVISLITLISYSS